MTVSPTSWTPEVYDAWLDPETPPEDAKQLLHENLDGDLEFHRVSRAVNAATVEKQRNDLSTMVEPINSL